ncbi:hypothetical protein F4810DRAFT_715592 [Camillea tinctor]|nr:hypothetical protein F4810DRAFT_715592 [Camillea tinctor]
MTGEGSKAGANKTGRALSKDIAGSAAGENKTRSLRTNCQIPNRVLTTLISSSSDTTALHPSPHKEVPEVPRDSYHGLLPHNLPASPHQTKTGQLPLQRFRSHTGAGSKHGRDEEMENKTGQTGYSGGYFPSVAHRCILYPSHVASKQMQASRGSGVQISNDGRQGRGDWVLYLPSRRSNEFLGRRWYMNPVALMSSWGDSDI